MATFYANPYDITARGWYFEDLDDFEKKYAKHQPVEEYSIEFIDGPANESSLAHTLLQAGALHQGNMDLWYDELELLDEDKQAGLYWLIDDLGMDLEEALSRVDDTRAGKTSPQDYVYDLLEDVGGPKALLGDKMDYYFDMKRFGRDLRIDGYDTDPDTGEQWFDGTDEELAEHFIESMGELDPKTAEMYFDVDALTRDMELEGSISEFDFADDTWLMTNPMDF